MNETAKRHWFRFSLKMLLALMALIAVIIGAFIFGYQQGYSAAKEESKADYVIFKSQ